MSDQVEVSHSLKSNQVPNKIISVSTFSTNARLVRMLQVAGMAVATLGADQVTKVWFYTPATSHLNTGVSLSWLAALNPVVLAVMLGFIIIAIAVLCRRIWWQQPLFAGLFFGGAVSNLLDRARWGGVRDWASIPVVGLKNNLADWAILFGILGISIALFIPELKILAGSKKPLTSSKSAPTKHSS